VNVAVPFNSPLMSFGLSLRRVRVSVQRRGAEPELSREREVKRAARLWRDGRASERGVEGETVIVMVSAKRPERRKDRLRSGSAGRSLRSWSWLRGVEQVGLCKQRSTEQTGAVGSPTTCFQEPDGQQTTP